MATTWPLIVLWLAASSGAAGATPATSVALDAGHPATLCLEGAADAAEGRRRPVLVVHAQDGGGLSVAADTGESTLIGLFPGGGFDSRDGSAEAQRFFLPGGPATRCWQIALQDGRAARIGLELSPPLE